MGAVLDARAVPAAYDAGINFFFISADMHWPLYEQSRRGLAMLLERGGGIRDDIVVGVVSYVAQPVFCVDPFREAVAAVPGLKRVDISIAGGCYGPDLAPRIAAYAKHFGVPQIESRLFGASFHHRVSARHAINMNLVDLAYIRYNPLHRGAESEVFAQLSADRALMYNFKSTIGYAPPEFLRAQNIPHDWAPHPTDYYRFALSPPEMDGILASPTTPAEVEAIGPALAKGPLSEDERNAMAALAMAVASRRRK